MLCDDLGWPVHVYDLSFLNGQSARAVPEFKDGHCNGDSDGCD